jgi:cell division septal protein FtsQ
MHATKINSYRIKKIKERQKRRKIVLLFCCSLLVIFGFLAFLCYSKLFQIKQIIISDTKLVNSADVYSLFKNISGSKKFFGLINVDKNILFLSESDCQKIQKNFTVLKNSYCQKSLMNQTVKLILEERKPIGVLCDNQELSHCFLFDDDGVLFFETSEIDPNLILIKNTSGNIFSLGDKISLNNLEKLIKLKNLLKDKFDFNYFELDKKDINCLMKNGFKIMMSLDKIDESINFLPKLFETKFDFNNLEYLDLRFLPKIYYK